MYFSNLKLVGVGNLEFLFSQESLSPIQWLFRGIIGFFFLLVISKLMGQRSISQLRFLDFVIALIIGNIIAHPLSDEKLGMAGSMITMSVLVGLYCAALFLSLKSQSIRKFFDPSPIPIVKDGQIIYKNLRKARISIDFLLSELRKEEVEDIQKVAVALWEPGGNFSFFLQTQYQPVTPSDMKIVTKSFSLPIAVIKEGKIDTNLLDEIGKDENWLKDRIKNLFNANINEILLATIDSNENVRVFLK